MDKQQIKQILSDYEGTVRPEEIIVGAENGKWFESERKESGNYHNLSDLQVQLDLIEKNEQLLKSTVADIISQFESDEEFESPSIVYQMAKHIDALIEENEKLKVRVLEAENVFYQLVEEQGLYCSDFGNLLPVEDQESEVIRKAINFMNSHIQKFKELSND